MCPERCSHWGRHSRHRGPAGMALQQGEAAQGLRVQCDTCRPDSRHSAGWSPPPTKVHTIDSSACPGWGLHPRSWVENGSGGHLQVPGWLHPPSPCVPGVGGLLPPPHQWLPGGLPVVRGRHLCLPFWGRGPARPQLLSLPVSWPRALEADSRVQLKAIALSALEGVTRGRCGVEARPGRALRQIQVRLQTGGSAGKVKMRRAPPRAGSRGSVQWHSGMGPRCPGPQAAPWVPEPRRLPVLPCPLQRSCRASPATPKSSRGP